MKGNISLKSFIEEVKNELKASINDEDPFFELGDVELEVSFALDAEAKAGAKLYVIDVGGSTKATQTHKVKITLTPFVVSDHKPATPVISRVQSGTIRTAPMVGSNGVPSKIVRPTTNRTRGKHRTSPVISGSRSNKNFSK
ncbi:trypco2 family protein [Shewanella frigidimarina]|uniref:trypco2 family protein n=1 Tax=Shewanella frigidimarina TaxID=56812 RepID=UPI003F9F5767